MNAQTYLKVSAINLSLLIAGALVGQLVERIGWPVYEAYAQEQPANRTSIPQSEYEYVTPGFTIGVAGFNQVLAKQIASDQVMVQGVDLLKLHVATLNLLIAKKVASGEEVQQMLDDSKVRRPLRLKTQQ